MQINSIKNNQINTTFNATLKVKGGSNHLADSTLEGLTKKAKEIGTNVDKITLNISDRITILNPQTKTVKGYENYIRAQFSFLSLPKKAYCTMYSGAKGATEENCNKNLSDALDRLVNTIKDSYYYHKK